MRQFVGRADLLSRLRSEWEAVRDEGEGRMVTIRGRRRVGKTWLVEEFIERTEAPHLFFAASRQTEDREHALFAQALRVSSLPSNRLGTEASYSSWQGALVAAGSEAAQDRPSVIVLDEFPYLLGSTAQSRGAVLGAVQTAWDRTLSKQPVLLILVGSDQAMMEMMVEPDQPLHQRPSRQLFVPPLNPAEAATLSGLTGAAALDSYLVTGGFPKVVRAKRSRTLEEFLGEQLMDDGTPLVTTGRLILGTELSGNVQARTILSVLGEGFRKRADIARAVGVEANNLKPPLDHLMREKRIVEARRPLSGRTSNDTRYEVVDPYLRFFLRFIERYRGEIERGRGRLVARAILDGWTTYRGKAIEALVRTAIDALLPDSRFGEAEVVGSYWSPDSQVEVDLVGADRRDPPARRVSFVGSIKWRESKPLLMADHRRLTSLIGGITGTSEDILTVGVSRSGVDERARSAFDVLLGPDDLLAAWMVR